MQPPDASPHATSVPERGAGGRRRRAILARQGERGALLPGNSHFSASSKDRSPRGCTEPTPDDSASPARTETRCSHRRRPRPTRLPPPTPRGGGGVGGGWGWGQRRALLGLKAQLSQRVEKADHSDFRRPYPRPYPRPCPRPVTRSRIPPNDHKRGFCVVEIGMPRRSAPRLASTGASGRFHLEPVWPSAPPNGGGPTAAACRPSSR